MVKHGCFVIYFDKKMACWYLFVGKQAKGIRSDTRFF